LTSPLLVFGETREEKEGET